MDSKPPKGICLWCGEQCHKNKIYCNHSHQQMYFYKTHAAYRQRQKTRYRKFNKAKVDRNLQIIVAAMMIEKENLEIV